MSNTIGNNIKLTLFGESHGEAIGCVIDGLPSGIKLDLDYIQHELDLRKPKGSISTSRKESDVFHIVSGLFEGYTTGTPLTILIYNEDQHSKDYSELRVKPRPGHADYTADIRYNGYQDYRGGGHFSGRITAPIVAAGAIFKQMLKEKEIFIGTHIKELAGIKDSNFANTLTEVEYLSNQYFAVIDKEVEDQMISAIEAARMDQDSIGGVLETEVLNLPAGLGNPSFGSIESEISKAVFSVGAVKGIEFGAGFGFKDLRGSLANDEFYYEKDEVRTKTNNNGGINGGISNGMPIIFRTVIKPTPSISKTQNTINLETLENEELNIVGRHDPCIVHRARIVIDSMVALTLVDLLISTYGRIYFEGDHKWEEDL